MLIESKKPRAQAEIATLKQIVSLNPLNLRETGQDTMDMLLRTTAWAHRFGEVPPLQACPSYPTWSYLDSLEREANRHPKLSSLVSPKTSKAFCHSEALAQELLTVLMVAAVASTCGDVSIFLQLFPIFWVCSSHIACDTDHQFLGRSPCGNSKASRFSSRRAPRWSMACCQWLSRSRALSSKFR